MAHYNQRITVKAEILTRLFSGAEGQAGKENYYPPPLPSGGGYAILS
ncbi:MAG: hypothetical protein LBJ14_03270 [Desulfarculales bacterium]|jgi:hypothetical protein|nr:hypothetical protein [Desulfarculales bacterium]